MIYDALENFGKYFHADSPFLKALCFALGFDPSKSDGRYENEMARLPESYPWVTVSSNRL